MKSAWNFIHHLRDSRQIVVLLIAYAKASFDSLRPEFLKKLKEKFDESE